MIHPVIRDDEHRYWIPVRKGSSETARAHGYSEISEDLGIAKPNPFYTEEGREEGVALHKWLLFLVQGKSATAKPDPRIAGRVEGIKKFIKDTKFKISGGEHPLYDPLNRFACTPDIWGCMGNWSWVIDAKRGAKLKSHKLQTAAQTIALRSNGFRPQKRGALYLRDGDYRLDEHDDQGDLSDWIGFVSTYHKKKRFI